MLAGARHTAGITRLGRPLVRLGGALPCVVGALLRLRGAILGLYSLVIGPPRLAPGLHAEERDHECKEREKRNDPAGHLAAPPPRQRCEPNDSFDIPPIPLPEPERPLRVAFSLLPREPLLRLVGRLVAPQK